LRALDPSVLDDELRRLMEVESTISPPIGDVGIQLDALTKDADLEELIHLYHTLPGRQRQTFLSVVRAIAVALSPAGAGREQSGEVG